MVRNAQRLHRSKDLLLDYLPNSHDDDRHGCVTDLIQAGGSGPDITHGAICQDQKNCISLSSGLLGSFLRTRSTRSDCLDHFRKNSRPTHGQTTLEDLFICVNDPRNSVMFVLATTLEAMADFASIFGSKTINILFTNGRKCVRNDHNRSIEMKNGDQKHKNSPIHREHFVRVVLGQEGHNGRYRLFIVIS
jgi:hypothetical protein